VPGDVPELAHKLEGISPRAYQHPADRAATAALRRIPYLDEVVKRLTSLGYERALSAVVLGGAVKLGERQLPRVWVLHRQVFGALDHEPVPDLYLAQNPFANALTFGAGKPVVVLNSELVQLLDDDGRRAVLAHEAAHVHSEHVLYRTALVILLNIAPRLPVLGGLPLLGIKYALLEWMRAAELSCDRGAALATRDPMAVCRALMTIAAGAAADELSLEAFIAQAGEYDEGGGGLDKLSRLFNDLNVTHPMAVRRVRHLLDWVRAGDYDRVLAGDYVRRGKEPPLKEEADAVQSHYAERISDAVSQAGESVGDLGTQLADWLKRTRGS
jgi:Zn-dependent protease with chaperone function